MPPDTFRRSPLFFALVLFCFLLPFATLSCPGGEITFSGLELVTGTTVQGERVPPDGFAVLAVLAAVGGLLAAWNPTSSGQRGAALAAVLCAVFLLLLKGHLASGVEAESDGMMRVSMRWGYWGALLSSTVAGFVAWGRGTELEERASAVAAEERSSTLAAPERSASLPPGGASG